MKENKYRYIGILDPKIADYWGISKHKNKPILVFNDRIDHVKDRHLKDFESEENILKIYNSLHNIIKRPDYVYYNPKSNGLEYYKKLDNNICVAVRINNGKVLKVKSWYPASSNKIKNRKKKEFEKEIDENLWYN